MAQRKKQAAPPLPDAPVDEVPTPDYDLRALGYGGLPGPRPLPERPTQVPEFVFTEREREYLGVARDLLATLNRDTTDAVDAAYRIGAVVSLLALVARTSGLDGPEAG